MANDTVLRQAVKSAVFAAGGAKALADQLGIKSQAVSQWARIPAERLQHVARITRIKPNLLRPDLYARMS